MKNNCFEIVSRYFNTCTIYYKNHYDALGLSQQATHGQIKSAYYKLSKIHHPDKNKGSEVSNDKFKRITEAYEVLGNSRARKLYDRGLGRSDGDSGGIKYWSEHQQKVRDTKGSRIPTARGTFTGKTPIYDFDEWSKAHYSETFERKVRSRSNIHERNSARNKEQMQSNYFISLICAVVTLSLLLKYTYGTDLDKPIEKSRNSGTYNK